MPDQLKLPFALWTRAAVRQLIKELFGEEMPIRTVGHYLKQWGYTPQKPVKRAYERNDTKVKTWLETDYPGLAKRAKAEGGEIHWGDETGISSADQVGRGYAPKGKTPVRRHKGKPERINMISTVTNQGKVRFMFYKDTMNSQRLISFLRRLVKDSGRKVFLILDNLRVHHSKLVKEWLAGREKEIEIHYLPSYSPDLNPDEYLNCDLKNEMSKRPEKIYPGETRNNGEGTHDTSSETSRKGRILLPGETNSICCLICCRVNNVNVNVWDWLLIGYRGEWEKTKWTPQIP